MAHRRRKVFTVVVVAVLVTAALVAAKEAKRRKQIASKTAAEIRSQLDDLDPATRAMVRAELASDVVSGLRDRD